MASTCQPRVQPPWRTPVRELSVQRIISHPWLHHHRHHLAQPAQRRLPQIRVHRRFFLRLPPSTPVAKATGRKALVRRCQLLGELEHLPRHRLCRLRQPLCRRKPLRRESLPARTVAVCPHNWPAGASIAQAGLTRISVADSTCRHCVISTVAGPVCSTRFPALAHRVSAVSRSG